ncbi:MAG: 3-oxoacyl-ACP reductase FabG [Aliivibrio sp.]|uniref:SDR family NAD(P)-dependent oxidoreductase n=1 Tax=Aliivibrio sp. TaxID=1872443 RepID=UPI001A4DC49F|nr:3-oxoacyl-ACP reductase FabG [Aliivibrio sp.]
MHNLDLTGKVAFVTGGSRGIGFAIATKFAEHGANLIISGRSNEKSLREAVQILSDKYNVQIKGVLGDVGNADDCQRMIKTAHKEFRRLDIFVNNAGVLKDGYIGMISQEDINDTLNTNLKGVINCTQLAARLMSRANSGSIINITSIIGRFGNEGQLVYGASKAGVIGATLSASKELAPKNIRVNAVAPGYIDTDMIKDIPSELHLERMNSIKMKRIGTPEDVANTVLFLASDLSNYVTGQVIGVDGGMVI